jgi:hypothetical protein
MPAQRGPRRYLDAAACDSGMGYPASVIEQARPNITWMMLRILLLNVDNQEIATFDSTTGNNLLTQCWATQVTNT